MRYKKKLITNFFLSALIVAGFLLAGSVLAVSSDVINASLTVVQPPDYIDTVPHSSTPLYIITHENDKLVDSEKTTEETDEEDQVIMIDKYLIITDFFIGGAKVIEKEKVVVDSKIILADTKPVFIGKVSIPYSYIFLKITSDPVSGTVQADANGNWRWDVPVELPHGDHLFFLAANLSIIEPEAENFFVLNLKIVPQEALTEEEKTAAEKIEKSLIRPVAQIEARMIEEMQADLTLEGPNAQKELDVFDKINIDFSVGSEEQKNEIENIIVTIRDANRNVVYKKQYAPSDFDGLMLAEKIAIPKNFRLGEYTIESLVQTNDQTIVKSEIFEVVIKQRVPFFGEVIINSEAEKILFTFFAVSLLGFLLAIFLEIVIFGRLAKLQETQEKDLKAFFK